MTRTRGESNRKSSHQHDTMPAQPVLPTPSTGEADRQALEQLTRSQESAEKTLGQFRPEDEGAVESIRATTDELASAIRKVRRQLK